MTAVGDYKKEAVDLWTRDPCGPEVAAEVGTTQYFEQVRAGRDAYSPWLGRTLDYHSTKGLDVLDVGCGQGIDLYHYAAHGARVTGIDLTPRHVELAQRHVPTANVVVGDAEQLPFASESFDRVSSNGVLHHTPDMASALEEILRVLRPGGEAIVIVYNRWSGHFWIDQILWRGIVKGELLRTRSVGRLLEKVERSSADAHPLVRVSGRRQLERMMREAGFENVRVTVSPMTRTETVLRLGLPRFGWYVAARARRQKR